MTDLACAFVVLAAGVALRLRWFRASAGERGDALLYAIRFQPSDLAPSVPFSRLDARAGEALFHAWRLLADPLVGLVLYCALRSFATTGVSLGAGLLYIVLSALPPADPWRWLEARNRQPFVAVAYATGAVLWSPLVEWAGEIQGGALAALVGAAGGAVPGLVVRGRRPLLDAAPPDFEGAAGVFPGLSAFAWVLVAAFAARLEGGPSNLFLVWLAISLVTGLAARSRGAVRWLSVLAPLSAVLTLAGARFAAILARGGLPAAARVGLGALAVGVASFAFVDLGFACYDARIRASRWQALVAGLRVLGSALARVLAPVESFVLWRVPLSLALAAGRPALFSRLSAWNLSDVARREAPVPELVEAAPRYLLAGDGTETISPLLAALCGAYRSSALAELAEPASKWGISVFERAVDPVLPDLGGTIELQQAKNDGIAATITEGGRTLRLASRFDPSREGTNAVSAIELAEGEGILLLGLGAGQFVIAALVRFPGRGIAVVERRREVWAAVAAAIPELAVAAACGGFRLLLSRSPAFAAASLKAAGAPSRWKVVWPAGLHGLDRDYYEECVRRIGEARS
ncbi:MAG: hypothetical protein HY720_19160 [Planctomycetes bacterium]|nr:hypothetical protein [Planctomycetota bacterium]